MWGKGMGGLVSTLSTTTVQQTSTWSHTPCCASHLTLSLPMSPSSLAAPASVERQAFATTSALLLRNLRHTMQLASYYATCVILRNLRHTTQLASYYATCIILRNLRHTTQLAYSFPLSSHSAREREIRVSFLNLELGRIDTPGKCPAMSCTHTTDQSSQSFESKLEKNKLTFIYR